MISRRLYVLRVAGNVISGEVYFGSQTIFCFVFVLFLAHFLSPMTPGSCCAAVMVTTYALASA